MSSGWWCARSSARCIKMRSDDLQAIRAIIARAKRWDALFGLLGLFALMVGVLTLATLFLDMAISGLGRLDANFFLNFPSRRASSAGILSAWVGTTLVMLVTAVAAVPLGGGAGVYLEEYAPQNWLTDIIATRESIRAIPQMIREGAFACGATTWQTVRDHIVPYASPGILTGVIIGMARAIGETAPIITIGALTFIAFLPPAPFSGDPPAGLFDWLFAPFTVMPIQMFNWTSRPEAAFQENAAAAGFVLVVMVLTMNGLAIWLRYRLRRNIKW